MERWLGIQQAPVAQSWRLSCESYRAATGLLTHERKTALRLIELTGAVALEESEGLA